MRRVVVTGLGLASSIGCTSDLAVASLRGSRSGLVAFPQLEQAGCRCRVYGSVAGWDPSGIARAHRNTMSQVAAYAATSALDAIRDAELDLRWEDATRIGVIIGTAFGGIGETSRMHQLLNRGRKSRAGAVGVTRFMNSTAATNVAAALSLSGRTYSVSTSFASGPDNIGHALELIRRGHLDVALCGSAEEDCWRQLGAYFENWGVLSPDYNDRPEQACRPYDAQRRGLIMSAGAGTLLLESLEHAGARGARIHAELVGYGSANDGSDMFRPTGRGLAMAIEQAMAEAARHGVERLDYVNTHGTGTALGDRIETEVIRDVLGDGPYVSSTKGLTGHALGAGGALEVVYTLLMMINDFVAPTENLDTIAPDCQGVRHVQEVLECPIAAAMSFSVGLGGANSSLVFRKFSE
jgi:3-oxoacyl-[acyl-carrier-protein] synthase-1